jgi:hypothetical protein
MTPGHVIRISTRSGCVIAVQYRREPGEFLCSVRTKAPRRRPPGRGQWVQGVRRE